MNQKSELRLQLAIVEYLQWQYPEVLFSSDMGGIKLTIGQAKQVKSLQGGRGWPDIFIAQPANGFHGCFGEIKTSAGEVYIFDENGNPRLRQSQHIQEQNHVLKQLRLLGYQADFWCGFDDAKSYIDSYLSIF